jgi:hypothetical protein
MKRNGIKTDITTSETKPPGIIGIKSIGLPISIIGSKERKVVMINNIIETIEGILNRSSIIFFTPYIFLK